jgi:hypothetical protein
MTMSALEEERKFNIKNNEKQKGENLCAHKRMFRL